MIAATTMVLAVLGLSLYAAMVRRGLISRRSVRRLSDSARARAAWKKSDGDDLPARPKPVTKDRAELRAVEPFERRRA